MPSQYTNRAYPKTVIPFTPLLISRTSSKSRMKETIPKIVSGVGHPDVLKSLRSNLGSFLVACLVRFFVSLLIFTGPFRCC